MNGRPFAADIAARLARPVRVTNDANCLALSEAIDGAAAGQGEFARSYYDAALQIDPADAGAKAAVAALGNAKATAANSP
jgi:hypothetical protein